MATQPSFLSQILQKVLSQTQDAAPPQGPIAPQTQPGAPPADPVQQVHDMLTQQAAQAAQTTQQAHQAGMVKGFMAGLTAKNPQPPSQPRRSPQTIADTAAPIVKLFRTLLGKVA